MSKSKTSAAAASASPKKADAVAAKSELKDGSSSPANAPAGISLQDLKALLESTVAPIAKRLEALEASKADSPDAIIKAVLASPSFANALPADLAADKKDSKLSALRD